MWCADEIFCSEEEYFFEIAEAVFVGWFSFEYVVRCDISSKLTNITRQNISQHSSFEFNLCWWHSHPPGSSRLHTSQSKWKRQIELKIAKRLSHLRHRFVKGAMNIVDLLGILPYYTGLILSLVTVNENFNLMKIRAGTSDNFYVLMALRLFHCIAWYCTIVWYWVVFDCIVWYCMLFHCIAWYCIVLHGVVQFI